MELNTEKPRLLYFNGPWDYVAERMRMSAVRFEMLLRRFFDVVSVEGSCDFDQCVDQYQPDLVLFSTGCECIAEPDVRILNTHTHNDIPRLAHMWRDPFTPTRLKPLNLFEQWGVDQVFFTMRRSDLSEQFDKCIYLPQWVEDDLFKDYGLEKVIPVYLVGSGWLGNSGLTPWRKIAGPRILQAMPALHAPSLGNWEKELITGENYARMLNRSYFAPSCGTICNYMTIRNLQVPASRCCLVVQDCKMVRAFGFKDGVNCLMSDGVDIVDKMKRLLNEPERLQVITDAGFTLVHENHTEKNRTQILDWYKLWKTRKPGQRIVQYDPFEPLQLVDEGSPMPSDPNADNPLFDKLKEGYKFIDQKRYDEALSLFTMVHEHVSYNGEANVGIGLCFFAKGEWEKAFAAFYANVRFMMVMKATVLDPVHQAFACVAALRANRAKEAVALAKMQIHVRHPALDSAREITISSIKGVERDPQLLASIVPNQVQNMVAIQLLPVMTRSEWFDYMCSVLGVRVNRISGRPESV